MLVATEERPWLGPLMLLCAYVYYVKSVLVVNQPVKEDYLIVVLKRCNALRNRPKTPSFEGLSHLERNVMR